MSDTHLEPSIHRWHAAVNDAFSEGGLHGATEPSRSHAWRGRAAAVVTDPVVVHGPKGAGSITSDEFVDWILRSRIRLTPRSWHPVGDRLMVVEQDADWPDAESTTRVATVFRVTGDRVSAVLRLPDLRAALELASLCRELAATG